MMSSVVWSAFYPVTLPRRERSAIWRHPIMSPHHCSCVS
jgi:hypothetical protein